MKNKIVYLGSLIVTLCIVSCDKKDENNNSADSVIAIPDTNFKTVLVENANINTNGNSEIEKSEASAYKGALNASSKNITNAKGLEYFINLERINFVNNELTAIDVSKNTKVIQLLLEENNLTAIDVSKLSLLTDLKVHTNALINANIANNNNSNMIRMELQGNPALKCIKVDAIPAPDTGWIANKTLYTTTDCN